MHAGRVVALVKLFSNNSLAIQIGELVISSRGGDLRSFPNFPRMFKGIYSAIQIDQQHGI